MHISDEALSRAIVKILEARYEIEIRPGYGSAKLISTVQLTTIQKGSVSKKYIDFFKARHPDVLIGKDTRARMETRAKYGVNACLYCVDAMSGKAFACCVDVMCMSRFLTNMMARPHCLTHLWI